MEPIATHGTCSACGTGEVNHRAVFILNVIDEVFIKTVGVFFAILPTKQESVLGSRLQGFIFGLFKLVGLVHYNTDSSKAASGRSELIWNEATRRAIRVEQMVLLGKYLDQYRARIGNRWVYFESLPIPPWLSQKGYDWMDDKLALAEQLNTHGVPAPRARAVTSLRAAAQAFHELTKPVIVKPRIGSRGRHTTTNIGTLEELQSAFLLGRQIARELVVQEHLFGSVCRATVVDGKLVGFFKADPPKVVGDGTHTVRELIAVTNQQRPERIGEIVVTEDVLAFIARKGYTLESVVPEGEVLDLTAKTGRFYGGKTKEMLEAVHPKIREVFEKAGKVVAAPVVGFDCIIVDPSADPESERWGIIECNSLPFIDLHYFALEGKPNDIAPYIWDLWEAKK